MPEHNTSAPVVAIDGPSGAGKSTVSKTLATAIDAGYLDTGAMYRAATLAVLKADVDPSQTAQVTKAVKNAKLEFGTTPEDPFTRVDGEDASAAIRGDDVTKAVSAVAGNKAVRKFLIAEQQRIIAEAKKGIAVEGREYAGGWWDWLTPFSLLTGGSVVVGYALLGAGWLILKTEGRLQQGIFTGIG